MSFVSGQVERGLSARPFRYRWLWPELWFIVFFVGVPTLGGASDESLSRCWYQNQQWQHLQMSWTLWGVGWEAPSLVFNFPGENLSPVDRRGDDGGFDVVYFLEASPWKSSDRLQLWRNSLVGGWRLEVLLEHGRRRRLKPSLPFSFC
jgi:hypothetical protein